MDKMEDRIVEITTLEHNLKKKRGSSLHGAVEMNLTRNHEVVGLILGFSQ